MWLPCSVCQSLEASGEVRWDSALKCLHPSPTPNSRHWHLVPCLASTVNSLSDQLAPEITTRSPTGPSFLPSFLLGLAPLSLQSHQWSKYQKAGWPEGSGRGRSRRNKLEVPPAWSAKTIPSSSLCQKNGGGWRSPPEGGRSLDSPLKPSKRTADVAATDTGPSEGRDVIFPN